MAVQEEGMVGRVGAREMEFLAEETIIEIEARFRHPAFKFIRGTFGPFEPNQRSQVPLWLALALKKRKRCRIVLPEWLDNDYLTEVLRRERMTADTFEELDYHFIEIANLLLKTAADEFMQPDRTKSLIEDIENVRMEKIRRGLRNISDTVLKGSSVMAVKMNNVGAMEITTVRDFLTEAMNMFYELSGQQDQGRGGGGRPMAVPNPAPAVGPNGPNKRLRRYRAPVT